MKESKQISTSSYNLRRNSCCFKSIASCFRSNSVDTDASEKDLTKSDSRTKEDSFSNCNIEPKKFENSLRKESDKIPSCSETSLKTDIALKSALLIQRWYRRYQSRIEMRKLTAWNIYQTIEYSGEQDQLKLYDFFLTLIKNSAIINHSNELINIKSDHSESLLLENQSIENGHLVGANSAFVNKVLESDLEYQKISKNNSRNYLNKRKNTEINIESSYKGMHINLPITKNIFYDLIENFKQNKPLHAKYVILILEETVKALKKLKNINVVSTNVSKNITVIGDLHGQLDDLMLIFYKNGLPSEDNPYIFNGDFVDRGFKSIEVSLIIFCGFLMSQTAVYINRGNHEDHVMNTRYGFIKEICNKYNSQSKKICVLYNEIFSWLPLATLIDTKIYVVHGGISDRTLIKDIYKIKREKYVSVLKPPILNDDGDIIKDLCLEDVLEWRQVLDALWSDPKKTPGIQPNSFRGGGCLFGEDITTEVMKKNNLNLIIRSHECKESGYEYIHGNKILTIFSASNYYEYGSNNGAYCKITSGDTKPVIVQFYLTKGEDITKSLSLRERVNGIEVSAIKHLLEKFAANKKRLLSEYKLKDKENKGSISLNDWCRITGDILELKLPWRILRARLAKLDKDGHVLYESTFEGLSFPQIKNKGDENISESLYRHKDILESIFRAIDKDHSGQISKTEFRDCCKLINHHDPTAMFSDSSIEDMANTMDLDKDGFINLNEFLEAFRLASEKV
ncbi:unnamed protein product [Brachionus calyciflorus]|uniref:Serine/threonine-protein phosphatase with EF-hands n=1 Tax=Brachionus calyciflorus TaxID=104777 RepID=A0A813M1W5_9BILA|nr:unnamed protein product [Brachionus calyciflorus]